MDNKCSLNRYGLGAKHLTGDVVESSPLPPPSTAALELQAGLQMPPFPAAPEGSRSAAPPFPTAALGNPPGAAPILLAAFWGAGVSGAPSVLQGQGGGGALCSPGAERCHRGGRRAGAPAAAPLLPPLPPRNRAALPSSKRGDRDTRGSPRPP